MAKKQQSESAAGQTPFGITGAGKKKTAAGNAKPRRVSYEPTDDGKGYIGETEYDNSGDGAYTRPKKSIHVDEESASDHLKKTFGAIDADSSLDAGEKRRKKAKTSLAVSSSQGTE